MSGGSEAKEITWIQFGPHTPPPPSKHKIPRFKKDERRAVCLHAINAKLA